MKFSNLVFVSSGQTFWQRHEAGRISQPPATKRGDTFVLFALNWTVKEPEAGTLVFLQKKNRLHKDQRRRKITRWTGFIETSVKKKWNVPKKEKKSNVKLWTLEQTFSFGIRAKSLERNTASPSSLYVCLLCGEVYYFREYNYRENHFIVLPTNAILCTFLCSLSFLFFLLLFQLKYFTFNCKVL